MNNIKFIIVILDKYWSYFSLPEKILFWFLTAHIFGSIFFSFEGGFLALIALMQLIDKLFLKNEIEYLNMTIDLIEKDDKRNSEQSKQ